MQKHTVEKVETVGCIEVQCCYKGCGDRRVNWDNPDTPRGEPRKFMAAPGQKKYYCSYECAAYDGEFSAKKESRN